MPFQHTVARSPSGFVIHFGYEECVPLISDPQMRFPEPYHKLVHGLDQIYTLRYNFINGQLKRWLEQPVKCRLILLAIARFVEQLSPTNAKTLSNHLLKTPKTNSTSLISSHASCVVSSSNRETQTLRKNFCASLVGNEASFLTQCAPNGAWPS